MELDFPLSSPSPKVHRFIIQPMARISVHGKASALPCGELEGEGRSCPTPVQALPCGELEGEGRSCPTPVQALPCGELEGEGRSCPTPVHTLEGRKCVAAMHCEMGGREGV